MRSPRRYRIRPGASVTRRRAKFLLFLLALAVTALSAAESPSKAPAPSKPAPPAATAAAKPGTAAPSTGTGGKAGPAGPVRLAYRWKEGQVLHQTSRQVQKMASEEDPSLNSDQFVVGKIVTKVVSVDASGTA